LWICLFTAVSRPALGPTKPPIQWIPGALSVGVKRPGREADHSLPSSAEFKNAWIYTSAPQYAFMAGSGRIARTLSTYKPRAYVHAPRRIGTHELSFRADQDCTLLRPQEDCDRQFKVLQNVN
jgi:hypothetical protein